MQSSSQRLVVAIIGKLPPPIMGPTVWLDNVVRSTLREHYEIVVINARSSLEIDQFGKISITKLVGYIRVLCSIILLRRNRPSFVLLPISQGQLAFIRDIAYAVVARIVSDNIILYMHGSEYAEKIFSKSGVIGAINRSIISLSSGGIVLSQSIYNNLRKYFQDGKLHVVENFIIGSNVKKLQNNKGYIQILWMSALHPRKGVHRFIEALCTCNGIASTVIVKIAGKWTSEEYRKRVVDLASKSTIEIQFIGQIEDGKKREILNESDIFVFTPVEKEGQPIVIIEAMESWLPVITTAKGGIVDMVKDGGNGFILEEADPKKISNKIMVLVENEDLRHAMAVRSHEVFEERFSERVFVRNMKKVLSAV